LGESPQDHRYIVTVPGRGCWLAESVQLVPDQETSIVAAQQSRVQVQISESRPWGWITAVVAGLLVLGGALALRFPPHGSPVLGNKDTLVVLADFANSTGEAVFDEALRQGLAIELEQSPFLRLVSDERIRQTLDLMRQAPDARLTREVAREICERTGSAAVLEGSIASFGTQLSVTLH
jgi:hypothetical protein